jgi:hypothetical protein
MHPEILRELTSMRGREMRIRAEQATLARSAIRARRARRCGGAAEAEKFVVPAVPDYVDGSFRTGTVPDSRPERVPSQRHAA